MCLNNENHVISIQEVEQAMYKTALACCKTEVQWVVCVGFTCSHLLNTAIYSQVVYNTTSILVETEPDGEAGFSLRYYPLFFAVVRASPEVLISGVPCLDPVCSLTDGDWTGRLPLIMKPAITTCLLLLTLQCDLPIARYRSSLLFVAPYSSL